MPLTNEFETKAVEVARVCNCFGFSFDPSKAGSMDCQLDASSLSANALQCKSAATPRCKTLVRQLLTTASMQTMQMAPKCEPFLRSFLEYSLPSCTNPNEGKDAI